MRKLLFTFLFLLAGGALQAQWNPSPPTPSYDDAQNLQPVFSAWRVADDQYFQAGTDGDFAITHDGTDTWLESILDGARIVLQGEDTGATMRTLIEADPDAEIGFYSAGTKVFETESDGLDMLTNPISNVEDPTDDQDAATKIYVDTEIAGAGGKLPAQWEYILTINTTWGTATGWISLGSASVDTEYLYVIHRDDTADLTMAQDDLSMLEIGGSLGDNAGIAAQTGTNQYDVFETSIAVYSAANFDEYISLRWIAHDWEDPQTATPHEYWITDGTSGVCGIRIYGDGTVHYRDADTDEDCAFTFYQR